MTALRVMLLDECGERRDTVARLLAAAECDVIACLDPKDDLLGQVSRLAPDVVIIDSDSPSRDTLESLREVQHSVPRPMVMFSQDDAGETIRRAVQAGVSAYVVDGIKSQRVRPILDAAIARFDQYRALQSELDKTRAQLAERKRIERAKGIVMRQRGLDETAAYQLLRKTAMDQNTRLVDIADRILATAQLLTDRKHGT